MYIDKVKKNVVGIKKITFKNNNNHFKCSEFKIIIINKK